MEKRVAFILLDGVGDVSYRHIPETSRGPAQDFRGSDIQTPLELSTTPSLDELATNGVCGMMDPFAPGVACGSDTAHLSMFGYPPPEFYSGRGCFECMGAGLPLDVGDVGFKCNFACLDETTGVIYKRRADRNFEHEGPILCSFLNGLEVDGFEEFSVSIKYATEHRCGIRIRGPNLSNKITGTDPLKDNLPLVRCSPTVREDHNDFADAQRTCDYINALSSLITERLRTHPINLEREQEGKNIANVILFRGAGVRLRVAPFHERHGMKGFMIAPTCIICGFGMNIGLDVVVVEGATGDVHSNFQAKGEGFTKALLDEDLGYEFGFLHIKGIDDVGHEGAVRHRVELIEKADAMIGEVMNRFRAYLMEQAIEGQKIVIAVTGDHTTPCSYLDHSTEPVPFLLSELVYREGNVVFGKSDGVTRLSETLCPRGYLGRFRGAELIDMMKRF